MADAQKGSAKNIVTSFLFVVYYLEWKSGQICPFVKKDNCNRKGIFKFLEELL